MKTKIFKDYAEFSQREDRLINGVSQEFADQYPNYLKENKTNVGCWNCSGCSDCSGCLGCSGCSGCLGCSGCSGCLGCLGCSDCSGCSGCFDCLGCLGCSDCSGCSGCSDCSGCSGCLGCSDCSGCLGCFGCSGQIGSEKFTPIKIENIHNAILEAVKGGDCLKMDSWHTCETTHCRAGWAVHLAGKEGYELEKKTSTEFAAMSIFHNSSPIKVPPTKFYLSNEKSMADIIRCAEEESKL